MYKTHALNCDATGRFPYKSDKGNEYILVAVYENYIHVEPLLSRSADSYVKAYAKVIDFFRKRNLLLIISYPLSD